MAENNGNNGKRWYRRPCFWGVLVILVVVGGLWWFGYAETWIIGVQDYFEERKVEKYLENQENRSAELKEMYKNDTYGGDIPEETLELFVEALKNNDLELASKYFVAEKQDEMLTKLPQAVQSGSVELLVDFYNNGIVNKECHDSSKSCDLGIEKDGQLGFYLQLVLNQQTNKWKISDL